MQFSKFAQRFQRATGTVQLMEDLGAAAAASGPVYMLGGGNPAHIPEAEEVFRAAFADIAADEKRFGKMVGEYDAPQGNNHFRGLLAELLTERFGWNLSAANIAITNGSQSSFGLIFNALAGLFPDGQRKKILLPLTPEYVGYSDVGLTDDPLFDGRLPQIERLPDRQFKYRVDFDGLDIDERYGAVCVSRPTNPTGNVITDNELATLSARCRARSIPLIIDGAYGLPFPNIVFGEATPHWDPSTILCLSLSKLGLPGLRTGIVIADTPLITLIRNANAINSLAPGRMGPELVTPLIAGGQLMELSNEVIRPYYRERVAQALSLIDQLMPDIPVRIHRPEGALFLWLWFEGLPISSAELYSRLVERGVYIIPGHHFFPGVDQEWLHKHECIRVNYAGNPETVEKGLGIIADVVRQVFADLG